MTRSNTLTVLTILSLILAAGCVGQAGVYEEDKQGLPQGDPEPGDDEYSTQANYNLPVGRQVEVCRVKYGLNNRTGPSTKYMVLRVLARGTRGHLIQRSGNWYKVDLVGKWGWSYGKYLCLVNEPSSPPSPAPGPAPTPKPAPAPSGDTFGVSRDGIINTCKAYVGYSYWWGGGRFPAPWDNPQGKDKGKCYSSTTSGHSGHHGADCSGFVSKVWQLPAAMPFHHNKHPYSTYNFYNGTNHWTHISRSSALKADAMVYRKSSGGHVVIFEKGDPWGQLWTYEARGCSWGVVHNLRTLSSSYRARRRHSL